jgi:serine/threonine protein kinase
LPLSVGHRLGPYEIVGALGAGGMGEVYRAKDTRLGRDVAVKVLPQHLSSNVETRARFEREAKTISSLNHPHICTLYDVGREGGIDYLVMELVEGETLAHRLEAGALATAETLELGAEIADALDRAHRAGVVHRDLKPANVMVTKAGAKLMDFGLARETKPGSAGELTSSPTVSKPLTVFGAILGTFPYMAPEQLEGKAADARADLWALGCVLYEMATGKRAFDGTTPASLITAIMGTQPKSISQLSPAAPVALDRIVGACLAKDPAERIQSAHDVKLQLSWIAAGDRQTSAPSSGERGARRRRWMAAVWGVAVLAAGAFIGWRALPPRRSASTPLRGSTSTEVVAKSLLTDIPGVQKSPNLSPDGKSLLFVSRGDVDDDIFLLRVGGENPVNLTEGHAGNDEEPAFSPDGERIAFSSQRDGGGIFVMGATGESPKKITSDGAHPSWSPDGRKVVYSTEPVVSPYWRSTTARLWVVDVATGDRKRLYEGDGVEPAWSPSGHRIAFWSVALGQRDIETIASDGGTPIAVTKDAATDWGPFWAADGRSLFFLSDRGGSPDLWRIAIDETTGAAQGQPEPVTSGVAPLMAGSVSSDGHRVAVEVSEARGEILRADFNPTTGQLQGKPSSILASANVMSQLELSEDGARVTYRTNGPRENIFVMRSDGSDRRRLTDDTFRNRGPWWIRGDWVIFYSNRSGSYELWLMREDGTELRRLTNRTGISVVDPVVSPDGKQVAMSVRSSGGLSKLAVTNVRDDWFTPGAQPAPVSVETIADAFDPRGWSPDGTTIGGITFTPQGPVGGTCSVKSGLVEHHEPMRAWNLLGIAWLPDSRRVVSWDFLRNAAVLSDVDARETRVLPGIPGPCELKLSRDGRTLLINRTLPEGKIWLLTLK